MNNYNEEYKRKIVLQAISDITATDNPELFARYNPVVFDVAIKVADILTEPPERTYEEGYHDGKLRALDILRESQKLDTLDAYGIVEQDFVNRLNKEIIAENADRLNKIAFNALYILGMLKEQEGENV